MPQQLIWFFLSIAFSTLAWSLVTARFIWPKLRHQPAMDALKPILTLHSFRFIGLAFLVPGVVSPDLPTAFAQKAAFGDLVAAILALITLQLLPGAAGVVSAWVFSIWGMADLVDAFYQAIHHHLVAGQLGAAYFLPTLIVPLLMITHVVAFRILAGHARKSWEQPQVARVRGLTS